MNFHASEIDTIFKICRSSECAIRPGRLSRFLTRQVQLTRCKLNIANWEVLLLSSPKGHKSIDVHKSWREKSFNWKIMDLRVDLYRETCHPSSTLAATTTRRGKIS